MLKAQSSSVSHGLCEKNATPNAISQGTRCSSPLWRGRRPRWMYKEHLYCGCRATDFTGIRFLFVPDERLCQQPLLDGSGVIKRYLLVIQLFGV